MKWVGRTQREAGSSLGKCDGTVALEPAEHLGWEIFLPNSLGTCCPTMVAGVQWRIFRPAPGGAQERRKALCWDTLPNG